MLIITNKKQEKHYFPDKTEDGKWTIFQMTKRYHWKKVWRSKHNSTFDSYKECEARLNLLSYSRAFGGIMDCSVWCGPDDRAKYILGIVD